MERTRTTQNWYEHESIENKIKFLQIYQLSINYAMNTNEIYIGMGEDLKAELSLHKEKVEKLKRDIVDHKEKTLKMRKFYRK